MFKQKGDVELVGCAIQLNLVEDDGHNIPDNAYKIRQLIVDEIKKYGGIEAVNNFNPQIIPLPTPPYSVILLDTNKNSIGYSQGFKIDNNTIWGGVSLKGNIEDNIKNFYKLFKEIASISSIKKVKRVGLIKTYNTKLSNLEDNYIISSHKDVTLKGATIDLKKELNKRNYDCRVVSVRSDESRIDFDVSLSDTLKVDKLKLIINEVSEKTARDKELNLFGIIKDLKG